MTTAQYPPAPIQHSPRAAFVIAAGWLAAGGISAVAAIIHSRSLDPFGGVICGRHPTAPHCGWCYAAVACILAAAMTLIWSRRPLAIARTRIERR